MNRDAAYSAVHHLTLARVDSRPDAYAEFANGCDDVACARHRLGWTLKGGKEAVASSVDLATTEPVKFFAYQCVVMRKKYLPRTIAQIDDTLGGPNDVGEQDGLQFPDERTTLRAISLKKLLVQCLRGWPRGCTEFLAQ